MVEQIGISRLPAKPAQPVADIKAAAKTQKSGGFGFHDFLSAINPLQYIPVVGTIYRSATGDTIPNNTRMIGSMVFSFLTGGPIGVATNAAADIVEKVIGVDPEKIGHRLLTSIGIGHQETVDAPQSQPKTATVSGADAGQSAATIDSAKAVSRHVLASYGVQCTDNGSLKMGNLQGADVLNEIELHRLAATRSASEAYSVVQRQNKITAG